MNRLSSLNKSSLFHWRNFLAGMKNFIGRNEHNIDTKFETWGLFFIEVCDWSVVFWNAFQVKCWNKRTLQKEICMRASILNTSQKWLLPSHYCKIWSESFWSLKEVGKIYHYCRKINHIYHFLFFIFTLMNFHFQYFLNIKLCTLKIHFKAFRSWYGTMFRENQPLVIDYSVEIQNCLIKYSQISSIRFRKN